jgi:hypothetical protein
MLTCLFCGGCQEVGAGFCDGGGGFMLLRKLTCLLCATHAHSLFSFVPAGLLAVMGVRAPGLALGCHCVRARERRLLRATPRMTTLADFTLFLGFSDGVYERSVVFHDGPLGLTLRAQRVGANVFTDVSAFKNNTDGSRAQGEASASIRVEDKCVSSCPSGFSLRWQRWDCVFVCVAKVQQEGRGCASPSGALLGHTLRFVCLGVFSWGAFPFHALYRATCRRKRVPKATNRCRDSAPSSHVCVRVCVLVCLCVLGGGGGRRLCIMCPVLSFTSCGAPLLHPAPGSPRSTAKTVWVWPMTLWLHG